MIVAVLRRLRSSALLAMGINVAIIEVAMVDTVSLIYCHSLSIL